MIAKSWINHTFRHSAVAFGKFQHRNHTKVDHRYNEINLRSLSYVSNYTTPLTSGAQLRQVRQRLSLPRFEFSLWFSSSCGICSRLLFKSRPKILGRILSSRSHVSKKKIEMFEETQVGKKKYEHATENQSTAQKMFRRHDSFDFNERSTSVRSGNSQ